MYAKMVADMRALTKRERQLISSLEGTERFIANYDPSKNGKQASVRLQILEAAYTEFFDVRRKIELLLDEIDPNDDTEVKTEDDQLEKNKKILTDFEDRYCSTKADLLEILEQNSSSSQASTSVAQSAAAYPKVKLPVIKLPSFNGNIREWITFRDSFRSLIDANAQLMDIDKFNYLRSSLSGEALQEIDSIELSAANYSVAWEMLQTRYENKKLIVRAHMDALFAVDGLKKESYDGLNHLISEFEKNLQMLEKIGERTSEWSTILAQMVCSRLDSTTLRNWETHHNSKEVPTYTNLICFLRNHCAVLQSVAPSERNREDRSSKPAVCHAILKSVGRCRFCNDTWHSAFHCAKFQRMTVAERNDAVIKEKLCRNCLNPGHYAMTCERGECHHCHQNHHSMLHDGETRSSVPHSQSNPSMQSQSGQQQQQFNSAQPNQQTQATNTATSVNSHTHPITEQATTSHNFVALPNTPSQNILLPTALVKVYDRFGNSMLARALLDSCSQHCLMTQTFSNKLKFRESTSYLSVQGIGPSKSTCTTAVTARVGPRSSYVSQYTEEMKFHVLPTLTVPIPTAAVNASTWNLSQSMFLADPQFCEPGPIDLIIGAEYFLDLLCNERQKATTEGPTMQNTVFGWIVSGRIPESTECRSVSLAHFCCTTGNKDQIYPKEIADLPIDDKFCLGGRLQHGNASTNRKRPVSINNRQAFPNHFLSGQQSTNDRNIVSTALREGIVFSRSRPRIPGQENFRIGEQPSERVAPRIPLQRAGDQYTEPHTIKYRRRRTISFPKSGLEGVPQHQKFIMARNQQFRHGQGNIRPYQWPLACKCLCYRS